MTSKHLVRISEWVVAQAPEKLVCYGLGSCLGIALFDSEKRIGGLAHTLLPVARTEGRIERPGRFVDSAIDLMRSELIRRGGDPKHLWAKLVGGANMFSMFNTPATPSVGTRNIEAARSALQRVAIPIVAEEVGANYGRSMEFDLSTGVVRIRTVVNRHEIMTL